MVKEALFAASLIYGDGGAYRVAPFSLHAGGILSWRVVGIRLRTRSGGAIT